MACCRPPAPHLAWPFFGPAERAFRDRLDAGPCRRRARRRPIITTPTAACRGFVRQLGAAGLLRACVPASHGGLADPIDSRLLCLARETLACHDGLADFAFAMQGLGTGAIGLAGSQSLQASILPKIARGEWIAAFALSEADAGSDVAAMTMQAPGGRRALRARRREDLDLQRRHRRCLYRLRAHGRGARARAASRPSSSSPMIPAFPSSSASR